LGFQEPPMRMQIDLLHFYAAAAATSIEEGIAKKRVFQVLLRIA